jgi:hypothetical protein
MYGPFAHSSYMPCPECGASVAAGEMDEHSCDPERHVEYQLFQLRGEMIGFDVALSDWLDSPHGRFAQWLAERGRSA